MRLLYFNPENDLALASNDPHYTPPASARQMAEDLRDFPRMWNVDRDIVLPWGWSPLAVTRLRAMGVAESLLPSPSQLEAYRHFASRQTAVRLLKKVREQLSSLFEASKLVGESSWCCSEEEVFEACGRYGASMLKMPWSGSGRGVRPVGEGALCQKDLDWVRRCLQRQGGVEVEPKYNKVQDLAMEFWAEEGRVRYEGLSLFDTTAGGVYAGNLVASEQLKLERLSRLVAPEVVEEVRCCLIGVLSAADIPQWYTGPLGVDMMVVAPHPSSIAHPSGTESPLEQGDAFSLHPLVEINLRMTMGWVALRLQQNLLPGELGTFKIVCSNGRYSALFIKKGV